MAHVFDVKRRCLRSVKCQGSPLRTKRSGSAYQGTKELAHKPDGTHERSLRTGKLVRPIGLQLAELTREAGNALDARETSRIKAKEHVQHRRDEARNEKPQCHHAKKSTPCAAIAALRGGRRKRSAA